MYSNFNTNNEVIQRGRKKIFSAKEKLELTLPNGKSDGVLDEGDLIYVVQRYKVNGKSAFRFCVVKFGDTAKQNTIYSAEKSYFKPYFEGESNVEGDTSSKVKEKKTNYTVPAIIGLSGGAIGYLVAQKFQKNVYLYGFGGLALGVAVGLFLLKNKK